LVWVRDADGRPASSFPLSAPQPACRGGVGMRAVGGSAGGHLPSSSA
jgi:hypothetical protein